MDNYNNDIICPSDSTPLNDAGQSLKCPSCDKEYRITDGVVRMMDTDDQFYEGAYNNNVKYIPKSESIMSTWPLWLINSGYLWEVRKRLRPGAKVIDLGCAGGIAYFGSRYRMIGCDLSFAALKTLDCYDLKIQADASINIPLPDNSVDGIISSFFWEHITPELKEKMLKECRRVLKDDGSMIFLYDVETQNPLIKRYKALSPALYRKLFIEGDGHFGYQKPRDNLDQFKRSGFDVVLHRGLEKTILQHTPVYQKLSQFGRSRFRLLKSGNVQALFYARTLLMRLIDTIICPILPADWARIDMVVLAKKG